MKSNRLFGILYFLLTRKKATARELANYFEVSIRTIYRDIEVLSSYSIPIYTEQGKSGGIQLLDNFQLDSAVLSIEERQQILFALQSLEKLSSHQYYLSDKLQWLFQEKTHSFIDIDFRVWGKSPIDIFIFNTMKQAIIASKKVEFLYFNSCGDKLVRKVEPLQIRFRYNAWYLFGYDVNKEDFRLFKLSRIQNLQMTNDTFVREIPSFEESTEEKDLETLILKIDKSLAYRVYDEFEKSCISVLEDGNFLVKVAFPVNEWLYGYILSFGSGAVVVEPTSIQAIIKKKLEQTLQNYL